MNNLLSSVLLTILFVRFTVGLQCQNGTFHDLNNQINVAPLKQQTCQSANYCYTKYYNDGVDISYQIGCDENTICSTTGCTDDGITKTCCCNNTDNCVPTGATDAIDFNFPSDFLFGTATSAYQVEGGYKADGKGPSTWDIFAHKPNNVKNNETGDIACDSYHQYKQDVQMIKDMKLNMYRFSISWSRIFPEGTVDKLNQNGVDYYDNLINELIANQIEPIVTIFHWDTPQYLQDQGGFLNPKISDWFADYTDFLFKTYGDRVKKWITINEPLSIVTYGYCGTRVIHAPGEMTSICEWSIYQAAHNVLKCHMKAANVYKTKYQKEQNGTIGITLSGAWYYPKDPNNPDDVKAARNSFLFAFGWFAHPIFVGDYSDTVKEVVYNRSIQLHRIKSRLPEFTADEIQMLKGSADFLGVNYYVSFESRAPTKDELNSLFDKYDRNLDWGSVNSYKSSWRIINSTNPWINYVPDGLRQVLNQLKKDYGDIKMIITENGCMDAQGDLFNDIDRIRYLRGHLTAVSRAINEDNVNVIGYTAWSLMDNFEWADGYETKFGLYHVNFNDPERKRTPKKSASFYHNVAVNKKVIGFTADQFY